MERYFLLNWNFIKQKLSKGFRSKLDPFATNHSFMKSQGKLFSYIFDLHVCVFWNLDQNQSYWSDIFVVGLLPSRVKTKYSNFQENPNRKFSTWKINWKTFGNNLHFITKQFHVSTFSVMQKKNVQGEISILIHPFSEERYKKGLRTFFSKYRLFKQ